MYWIGEPVNPLKKKPSWFIKLFKMEGKPYEMIFLDNFRVKKMTMKEELSR